MTSWHVSPDIDFLCTEVHDLCCLHLTSGHDNISARETALSITPAVTDLFNISIRLGELPDEWKISRVTPIPKSCNHSDPASYCLISLLSILSKLLEKHIQNILIHYFEDYHPISTQEWGFTQGKSTTGALRDATDHWFREMEQGHDICTIFFNYSKVFDSVPHRLLLQRLKTVVFTNRSLDGLHIISAHVLNMSINCLGRLATNTCYFFLCDMQEKFRSSIRYFPEIISIAWHVVGYLMYIIATHSSVWMDLTNILPVSSGLPHPRLSALTPAVYYPHNWHHRCMTIYADDIMLYRPIHTTANYEFLQQEIEKLCTWTSNNPLKFNSIKCR